MTGRRVFHSFHFVRDSHRVAQVRQMGSVEGQTILSSNEWESIKAKGEASIKRWIDEQMAGKSCVVVLIGSQTAGRRWVNYEIERGWNTNKGLVGVYIHRLKNLRQEQDSKGGNPFGGFTVGNTPLSSIVKAYDPPFAASRDAYEYIKANLADWVEEAINIRRTHDGRQS